jgi:hypothetical protein
MAEHGDFQLMVTIPPENLAKAKASVPTLIPIGKVSTRLDTKLRLSTGEERIVDPAFARTLLHASRADLRGALGELSAYARREGLP